MKIKGMSWGILGGLAFIAISSSIIIVHCVKRDFIDMAIVYGAFLGFVILFAAYMIYHSLTYDIDEKGIKITRLGKELYFLPWEQVKTIGIQKGYRQSLIVYVSRYDAEGTKGLVKSLMVLGGRLDSATHALNGAVLSKSGRKTADQRPLLVLAAIGSMELFRNLQRFQIRSTNKTGAPPAETLIDFTYIEPWCG
jgi:hypothetical protein